MSKRCIIITSYIDTSVEANIDINCNDYIICADGGFKFAVEENIIPHAVIGDFDSMDYSYLEKTIKCDRGYSGMNVIKATPEKDEPDTMMCVKHAMSKGYKSIVIIGGMGGRIDHTIANLQTLSYILDEGGKCWIIDGSNKLTMLLGPDKISLDKDGSDYFSIFSFTEICTGVYEENAKYPLVNATLIQSFPIGTSNEFLDGPAIIKVDEGKLLVIKSTK